MDPQELDFEPIDFQPEPSHAPAGPHQPTDEEWAAMPVGERVRNMLQFAGRAVGGAFMGPAGVQAADNPGATLAAGAIPGVLSMAVSHGAPVIQSAARGASQLLDQPLVGGGIGAAEGYRRGGVQGAVTGAIAGAAGTSALARGLRKIGGTVPDPVAAGMSQAGGIKPGIDGANEYLDEVFAKYGLTPTANPPAAAPPSTPSDTLRQEILARIQNPDWRTQDVVPINARQTKGIIEPGESRIGLAEKAASAAKVDPAEAERLLKALRQRMHISDKTGR